LLLLATAVPTLLVARDDVRRAAGVRVLLRQATRLIGIA
jgi:hypothetical protein